MFAPVTFTLKDLPPLCFNALLPKVMVSELSHRKGVKTKPVHIQDSKLAGHPVSIHRADVIISLRCSLIGEEGYRGRSGSA